jgi:hypothetical protein
MVAGRFEARHSLQAFTRRSPVSSCNSRDRRALWREMADELSRRASGSAADVMH